MMQNTKDTIIVMFTKGYGDAFVPDGLRYVNLAQYQMAVANCEDLTRQIEVLIKNKGDQIKAGDITRNQIDAIEVKVKALQNLQYQEWEKLKASGEPVEYVKFWQGTHY
jgi:hypothetical protein